MDEPNETQETAEETPQPQTEAPETVESDGQTDKESPPWGDDFDAQRAWNTIQTLRDEVKETKQSSQEEREQAQQEALAWQILASPSDYADEQVQLAANIAGVELEPAQADQDEEGEFVDPVEQRLEGVEQWRAEQERDKNLEQFGAHLDDLAGKAEVKLTQHDRDVLLNASVEAGFTPEATEKAFEKWHQQRKDYDKEVIERYRKSKNAPHVAKGGSQATEDVLPLNATPSERQQWMTERFQVDQQR